MHPQRIFLRIVDGYRSLGSESHSRLLIITEIVTGKRILILLIHIHHIAITRALAILHIVETIAGNRLVLIHQGRTAEELSLIGPGIIITICRMHHTGTGNYLGRSHHVGGRGWNVIIQGIGGNHILTTAQLHIEDELCLSGLGMIFSPVGNQSVLTVDERTSVKEVRHVIQTVKIQTVRLQGLSAMVQYHISAGMHHLHHTIIFSPLAGKRQGITLTVMHMTESLHRVGSLIEIGTVAGEMTSLVHERNLALYNLGIRVSAKHIVAQLIGMKKIDSLTLRALLVFLSRCLHSLHQTKPK